MPSLSDSALLAMAAQTGGSCVPPHTRLITLILTQEIGLETALTLART
jgi:hypothetical protein